MLLYGLEIETAVMINQLEVKEGEFLSMYLCVQILNKEVNPDSYLLCKEGKRTVYFDFLWSTLKQVKDF